MLSVALLLTQNQKPFKAVCFEEYLQIQSDKKERYMVQLLVLSNLPFSLPNNCADHPTCPSWVVFIFKKI